MLDRASKDHLVVVNAGVKALHNHFGPILLLLPRQKFSEALATLK